VWHPDLVGVSVDSVAESCTPGRRRPHGWGMPSRGGRLVPWIAKTVLRGVTVAIVLVAAFIAVEALYERTDAFRQGNRFYYRDGRATLPGRLFARFWSTLARVGLVPPMIVSLETIGSRSGRRRAVPMVVARHDGAEYLVSMLGERSPWVHNVRADGGRAWLRRGSIREVRLVEVPAADRAPVIKAYLGVAAGARPHIPVDAGAPLEAFERVARDYPVFRIEPA
jgi:deazaflavin-dependent oxidoreductase (nitroreductase family)